MIKIVVVGVLLCATAAAQNPKPLLRHIPLSAEQNRLLMTVQKQMDELEQQARQVMARKQAIIDTIAATNKVQNGKLNEIKPGEFEIEEVEPPKVEPVKPKEEKP